MSQNSRRILVAAMVLSLLGVMAAVAYLPTRPDEAQERTTLVANTYEQLLGQGSALYADHCASCHGTVASGGVVKDFVLVDEDGVFIEQVDVPTEPLSDVIARLGKEGTRSVIEGGVENTPMPAWAPGVPGGDMTETQIDKIMDYLQSAQQ